MTRSESESFINTAPKTWSNAFSSIIIYESNNESINISFHPKEKALAVHVSENYSGDSSEVIEEIAIASQAIKELGHLPKSIASQKKYDYRQNWLEIGG